MKFTGGVLILCLVFAASVNSVAIKKEGLDSQSGSSYPPTYPPTTEPPRPTTDPHPPTTHEPYTSPRTSAYPTSHKPTYPPTSEWYPTSHKPSPTYPDTTAKTTHKPPEDVSCFFHTIYKEKENIIMEGDENIHETPEDCETSCYVSTFDFLHFSF